jgi:hypothetical protein
MESGHAVGGVFTEGVIAERGRESLIAVAPGGRSARARRAPARGVQIV